MGSTCGGSLAGEKAVIQSLIMAPREQVAQAVGEAAASVLADLWQSYNSPLTDKYPSLDLAGGVVVKGEPTDFTLQVRQVPAGQEYELRVGERSLAITIQELSEEQAVLVFHGETPEAKQVAGELAFTPVRHDPETPESILLYHK